MRLPRSVLVPALAAAAAACGGTSVTTTAGPSPLKCAVTASTSASSFGHEGGSGTLAVETTRDCSWTASALAPWITLSSAEGQGSASVAYTVSPNSVPSARSGAIRVEDRQIQISQGAAPCRFELDAASHEIGPAGGELTVRVSTLTGCAWSAGSGAAWISLVEGAQGGGPGQTRFSVAPNGGAARTATVTVAGQAVTIIQRAAGTGGCTAGVAPVSHDIAAGGGDATVQVQTGAGCAWTAESHVTWLTVIDGATGSGSGTVRFRAAANSGAARTGTLAIAGRNVTVHQQGAGAPAPPPPPACSYSLAPESQSIGAAGGAGSVSVSAASGCTWTAASNAAWITIAAGSSGTGNGQVQYTVLPNTSSNPRTGTLTVAGRTHTVTQEGVAPPTCSYSIAPESQTIGVSGGQETVSVTSGPACGWSATSNADWITVSGGASGSGDGQVQYIVAAHDGRNSRTGTLTIAGHTHTVQQSGSRDDEDEVEGTVTQLTGSCPNLSFRVAKVDVITDSGTRFKRGSCTDLRNGSKVVVAGRQSGDTLHATEVELEKR